jgi:hypothetical protein
VNPDQMIAYNNPSLRLSGIFRTLKDLIDTKGYDNNSCRRNAVGHLLVVSHSPDSPCNCLFVSFFEDDMSPLSVSVLKHSLLQVYSTEQRRIEASWTALNKD